MDKFTLELTKPEVMWVYQALVYMLFGLEHFDASEGRHPLAKQIALTGANEIKERLKAMMPTNIANVLDVAPKYEVNGLSIDEWVADYRESFKAIELWLGVKE